LSAVFRFANADIWVHVSTVFNLWAHGENRQLRAAGSRTVMTSKTSLNSLQITIAVPVFVTPFNILSHLFLNAIMHFYY
jgi:hypothetical protein